MDGWMDGMLNAMSSVSRSALINDVIGEYTHTH